MLVRWHKPLLLSACRPMQCLGLRGIAANWDNGLFISADPAVSYKDFYLVLRRPVIAFGKLRLQMVLAVHLDPNAGCGPQIAGFQSESARTSCSSVLEYRRRCRMTEFSELSHCQLVFHTQLKNQIGA